MILKQNNLGSISTFAGFAIAAIAGGVFKDVIWGLVVERRKIKQNQPKSDAEAEKLGADSISIIVSAGTSTITMLTQRIEELEKDRKQDRVEMREDKDRIDQLETEVRQLKRENIALREQVEDIR